MGGRNPPWSDLPPELLTAIANFLHSDPTDILRFRSVCKSWNSSLSHPPPYILSPIFPIKTPPVPHFLRNWFCVSSSNFLILSSTVIYALRPPFQSSTEQLNPKIWLVFLDQLNPGNKVIIRRPFTRQPYSLPLDFPHKLNLLDFHASEIGRYYNLSLVDFRGGKYDKPRGWSEEALKIVLFSNGLAVVVLFDAGKLGLLRLGFKGNNNDLVGCGDNQWEVLHDGKGFRFDDIVNYKGRIVGIDRRGRLYEMGHECDSSGSGMNVVGRPIMGGGGRRKRLVESLGRLYLVVRFDSRGTMDNRAKFKVYEFNEGVKIKKWVEVSSIGDRVFFFGYHFSFSASAQELVGFSGKNCVIFEDRSFRKYDGGYSDLSPFDKLGRDDLHVGVFHLEDNADFKVIGSFPGYSNIFWPPPNWIWSNDKLKLLETAVDNLLMRTLDEDLKAKFKDLSALMGPLISGLSSSEQDLVVIWKQAQVFVKLLSEIIQEVDKLIAGDASSMKKHTDSLNLQNQAGTSNLRIGERQHGSDGGRTTQCSSSQSDDARLSSELHPHADLIRLLQSIVSVFAEHFNKFKDYVECSPLPQACVSANEETRLSQGI